MSDKQDRISPRTATDLERKYKFGQTFAEIIGLVNDSRDKVDSVESSLKNEITNTESRLARSDSEILASVAANTRGINSVGETVSELSSKVELKMDANAVNIAIDEMIVNGVEKVVTKTGYVFDSDGLNISKSGEEISNLLDHTGMYVKKANAEDVLVANNEGVKATDLHAKTYLIIGSGDGRCRFEDYGIDRTACFWVGG